MAYLFMTEINEYVEAEFENIERLVEELPAGDAVEKLSALELSGTAALIHGFYNGIENILKQVVVNEGCQIPDGPSWHRDLITLAVRVGVIQQQTAEELKGYLAFRHFFSHAYSFDLDKERIIPLVRGIPGVTATFTGDIKKFLS
jgi:uncharacterized protein YutE (UPF0331/DUF86 family)